MSIRAYAMESSAFQKLKEVYDNRESVLKELKKNGTKIVGKLGCDVPDEFIIAAGMLPVQIYADPDKELKETNKYLEYAFDPMVRAQFEKIVDGTYYDLIDYLVISNSTDVLIRVYLYLRELKRVEPEKPVPPVEFIDWLFTRNRLHQARNEFTLQLFRETVEKWAEKPITDDDIIRAAKICNSNRAALRKMAELRQGKEVRISGSEALVIIGSAFFMDRETHTQLVEEVINEASTWPVITGPRIFVTGSNHEDTSLYDLIEDAGGIVVGEDHDWGNRFFQRDFNTDYSPVRAVTDCYMLREFSSKKSFVSQRVDALNRQVSAVNADAVIFYTNIYEEAASWDYPSQKYSLEKKGISTASFAKMKWPVNSNEDLKDNISKYINSLKGGVKNG